jgi:hypothetical protein
MSEMTETRWLSIECYSEHPEVVKVAEMLVDKYLQDKQRVRNRAAYFRDAKKLIASIWVNDSDLFRFTTKTLYFSKSGRKQVWLTNRTLKLFKAMLELDWVTVFQPAIPPYASTKSSGGMATIYCRRKPFKDMLKSLQYSDITVNPDLPRVELKGDDEKPLELPGGYLKTSSYKKTVRILEAHTELLNKSNITDGEGLPLSPRYFFYQRKFKGDFAHGGRLYSGYEQLPKTKRLSIKFGGSPAIAFDLSQLHPSLILRIDHNLSEEDGLFKLDEIYRVPGFDDIPRSAHKEFINTIINAKSHQSAIQSISTATIWWDEQTEEYVVKTFDGRQKRKGFPLFNQPVQSEARRYLESFLLYHPYFAESSGKEVWGILQLVESELMLNVIDICTKMGVPVFIVHDEVVMPNYCITTFDIVMKRVFQATLKGKGSFGKLKGKWSWLIDDDVIVEEPVEIDLEG